jgi:hypothetical protein
MFTVGSCLRGNDATVGLQTLELVPTAEFSIVEQQQFFRAPNRGENVTLLWKVCTPNCLSAANLAFDGFVNTRKARGKYHGSEETSS